MPIGLSNPTKEYSTIEFAESEKNYVKRRPPAAKPAFFGLRISGRDGPRSLNSVLAGCEESGLVIISSMKKQILACFCLGIICCFSGCAPKPTATPTLSATPEATPTPEITPTPTPPPSVAIVNGVYIAKEDLARETDNLNRAVSELGLEAPEDAETEALNGLIDDALLTAYALKNGYVSDPEAMNERIAALAASVGGEEALRRWQQANGYTEDGFRRALDGETAVTYAREKLLAEKLPTVEQIHAYQILTATRAKAQEYVDKLGLGFDFISLARGHDTISGGDLDWIARGILVYPELEDALFSLEPGGVTPILETELGFHLLFAAEKSFDRPLSQQARETVERQTIQLWLSEARESADIRYID